MTTVRIGFEVLVYANVRRNPEMQGGLVRFGRSYALVKQVTREGPLEVWVRIGTPLGGDIQHIYPMERPAVIAGPFSLADSVENLRPGRSQAHKPDSSSAQTM
jgi:hypothetical protein